MLTKNFYAAMGAALTTGILNAVDLSGASRRLWYSKSYWEGLFTAMNSYSDTTEKKGVKFGKGTTPAAAGDYKLENEITTGITVAVPSSVSFSQTDSYIEWTVTLGVAASVETTISEIGLAYGASNNGAGTYSWFLVDRTVLDTPVTIPAGQSKQITYTIRFNYGGTV